MVLKFGGYFKQIALQGYFKQIALRAKKKKKKKNSSVFLFDEIYTNNIADTSRQILEIYFKGIQKLFKSGCSLRNWPIPYLFFSNFIRC